MALLAAFAVGGLAVGRHFGNARQVEELRLQLLADIALCAAPAASAPVRLIPGERP